MPKAFLVRKFRLVNNNVTSTDSNNDSNGKDSNNNINNNSSNSEKLVPASSNNKPDFVKKRWVRASLEEAMRAAATASQQEDDNDNVEPQQEAPLNYHLPKIAHAPLPSPRPVHCVSPTPASPYKSQIPLMAAFPYESSKTHLITNSQLFHHHHQQQHAGTDPQEIFRVDTPDSNSRDSLSPPSPRIGNLHHRLGLPSHVPLEFVNGGHGVKNPLAASDRLPTERRTLTDADSQDKFVCNVCSKVFHLQRLLNRHLKCHSDIKRYLCVFCSKGFNDTFDLKRHTRTHTGVRPYICSYCCKSFTQRCSLESHLLKVHGVQHQYAYKERRAKMYVCEECGHTTSEPEVHYIHLKDRHPYSPALLKFHDKRHFKFNNNSLPSMILHVRS